MGCPDPAANNCGPAQVVQAAGNVISDTVGGVIGGVAKAGVEGLADALREGASWVITTSFGWWIAIPSINLEASAVDSIRSNTAYLSLVVASIGMIWGGVRLAFRRKADPAWDLGTGLLRLAAVSALGVAVPQLLLRSGDSFSNWVLDSATSGEVSERLGNLASMAGINAPGAVIFTAMFMILAGSIQAVQMFLREGGIVILTGVMLLAAAGGFNPATQSWFPKVAGWLVALILYKPMAALVYAAALSQIGTTDDPRNVFIGLAMMTLSIVAMPTMMKFFTWAAPGALNGATGGHGAGTALMGAGLAAAALGKGGGGGRSASDHEQALNQGFDASSPAQSNSSATPATGGAASPSASGNKTASAAAGAASSVAGPVVAAAQAAQQLATKAKDSAGTSMTGEGGDQ